MKKETQRNIDIETALWRMKDMFILYDRALQRGDNEQANKALQETHRAQNALYDAIGGMEDHKFAIRDTEDEE